MDRLAAELAQNQAIFSVAASTHFSVAAHKPAISLTDFIFSDEDSLASNKVGAFLP
jgi:hypothetical protein